MSWMYAADIDDLDPANVLGENSPEKKSKKSKKKGKKKRNRDERNKSSSSSSSSTSITSTRKRRTNLEEMQDATRSGLKSRSNNLADDMGTGDWRRKSKTTRELDSFYSSGFDNDKGKKKSKTKTKKNSKSKKSETAMSEEEEDDDDDEDDVDEDDDNASQSESEVDSESDSEDEREKKRKRRKKKKKKKMKKAKAAKKRKKRKKNKRKKKRRRKNDSNPSSSESESSESSSQTSSSSSSSDSDNHRSNQKKTKTKKERKNKKKQDDGKYVSPFLMSGQERDEEIARRKQQVQEQQQQEATATGTIPTTMVAENLESWLWSGGFDALKEGSKGKVEVHKKKTKQTNAAFATRRVNKNESNDDNKEDTKKKIPKISKTKRKSKKSSSSSSSSSDENSAPDEDDDDYLWPKLDLSKMSEADQNKLMIDVPMKRINQDQEATKRKKRNNKNQKNQKNSIPTWPTTSSSSSSSSSSNQATGKVLKSDGNVLQLTGRVARSLRDYQMEGVRWLCQKYSDRLPCVLGDDMGMGKTVQIVAFLSCIFYKTGTYKDITTIRARHIHASGTTVERNVKEKEQEYERNIQNNTVCPALIVVPPAVLYNWKREIDTWGCFDW